VRIYSKISVRAFSRSGDDQKNCFKFAFLKIIFLLVQNLTKYSSPQYYKINSKRINEYVETLELRQENGWGQS